MKTQKTQVRWSDADYNILIPELIKLREEDPIQHALSFIKKAVLVLPEHRRRTINTIMACPELVRKFENAWIDYITLPNIVEVERLVEPVKPFISEFSIEQLMAELGSRFAAVQRDQGRLMEEHAQRVHPTLTLQAALVETFPEKAVPVSKPVKIRIGLLGFLPGQVHHLENKLSNHRDRFDLVPRGASSGRSHRGFGMIDAVICFKNFRDHSTEKFFENLKGKVPLGRATGLEDAARMATNLCLGNPIDTR